MNSTGLGKAVNELKQVGKHFCYKFYLSSQSQAGAILQALCNWKWISTVHKPWCEAGAGCVPQEA